MIVIEEDNNLKFFRGEVEISKADGFAYFDKIYQNEPPETKRIIDQLKKRYKDKKPN